MNPESPTPQPSAGSASEDKTDLDKQEADAIIAEVEETLSSFSYYTTREDEGVVEMERPEVISLHKRFKSWAADLKAERPSRSPSPPEIPARGSHHSLNKNNKTILT